MSEYSSAEPSHHTIASGPWIEREIGVVLGERKAGRICEGRFPARRCVSTTRLLLTAAGRARWSNLAVADLFLAAIPQAPMAVLTDERILIAHLGLPE